VDFVFDQACKDAQNELKRHVTSAPIMQPPNQDEPFKIICDASNKGCTWAKNRKEFVCYRICFPHVRLSVMQLPYN